MTLKPWREIAVPHEDVLKGTFQQAEFAADISRVHEGTASLEYQDPILFFQRTFITEGMNLLLNNVLKRLTGQGGDPVIQLQTAFGGGKTHTMLAVYHLAKGDVLAAELEGIPEILNAAGISTLPKARIAVLDGISLSPNQSMNRNNIKVHTMWGELAVQLGGQEAYEFVKDADLSGTSPGKVVIESLLLKYAPCVILIDELVAYIRQFEEGMSLSGGTFDSNLTFIQALTEAVKGVPTAILLASLPESDKEAGGQRGGKTLNALSHYFARIHALWKPVSSEEGFEIVKRRLFTVIKDLAEANKVCSAFASVYINNKDNFPNETQESHYSERLKNGYPIHPEVFDRLYKDWSSLDNFQRTRGVLKLMAKVIYRLWKDGNNDLLIMPGNIPLYDADTRNEAIYYLPQGWDPVVEREVDGEHAESTTIENHDTRLGSIQACRRVCRTIFLGSAPTTANQMVRGVEIERVLLGAIQPAQKIGIFNDALRRLTEDRLHYLYSSNNRYWFDTRPNLRREMEERKHRFNKEDIYPEIRTRLQNNFTSNVFNGIHIFSPNSDIPDDWQLRLVVLPPNAAFSRNGHNNAFGPAEKILRTRGDQPRQKQNRLIFLAADYDSVNRLIEQVRTMMAWRSIVNDIKDMKLNPDQFQSRQAEKNLEDANDLLERMIRETYKWIISPTQEEQTNGNGISDFRWEYFPINTGAPDLTKEIEHSLKENEILITEWSPIHLSTILKKWFWKEETNEVNAIEVWQKTCCYLYLPRLKNEAVFKQTLIDGADSQDFFALSQGKENNKYIGFSFNRPISISMDSSLLLINPSFASTYLYEQEALLGETQHKIEDLDFSSSHNSPYEDEKPSSTLTHILAQENKKQFYANIELDPIQSKKQFADIVDEVILQFTLHSGVKVKIFVEIQAESESGFDENLQRTVKENCKVLQFKSAEFEEGE
ncbi:ATP-binding protein [Legionella sainthelensi]|uniref:ATP-binding protein n=1 Tax=Legionella sainthelensi TaxID=28087 RepID=UPI000E20507B|nr:DUF499 domain-containing protein [Legionella sainthelensi]